MITFLLPCPSPKVSLIPPLLAFKCTASAFINCCAIQIRIFLLYEKCFHYALLRVLCFSDKIPCILGWPKIAVQPRVISNVWLSYLHQHDRHVPPHGLSSAGDQTEASCLLDEHSTKCTMSSVLNYFSNQKNAKQIMMMHTCNKVSS